MGMLFIRVKPMGMLCIRMILIDRFCRCVWIWKAMGV